MALIVHRIISWLEKDPDCAEKIILCVYHLNQFAIFHSLVQSDDLPGENTTTSGHKGYCRIFDHDSSHGLFIRLLSF